MTCFSRRDANKELFARKIRNGYNSNKERRNYSLLLDVKNGTLFCKNRNFTIDELCVDNNHPTLPDAGNQLCALKTGEEIEMNMFM